MSSYCYLCIGKFYYETVHLIQSLNNLLYGLHTLCYEMQAYLHGRLVLEYNRLIVPSAQLYHNVQQWLIIKIQIACTALNYRIGVDARNIEAICTQLSHHAWLKSVFTEIITLHVDTALNKCNAGIVPRICPHEERGTKNPCREEIVVNNKRMAGIFGNIKICLTCHSHSTLLSCKRLWKLQRALAIEPNCCTIGKSELAFMSARGLYNYFRIIIAMQ